MRSGWCGAAGLSRKYAINLLKRPPMETRAAVTRRRMSRCSADVSVLARLREVPGHLCGKRLAAAVPVLIDALLRHGEIELTPMWSERLPRIRASGVDRLLQSPRHSTGWRGAALTNQGTLLK